MERSKYPRTVHLPWSPGATSDDRRLDGTGHLEGHEVVVTEKVDGENTTVYPDGTCHARSLDGRTHPSQHRMKALAAAVAPSLPPGTRLVGENAYARHTIPYDGLPGYFLAFAAVGPGGYLPWDETESLARSLGVPTVPVLYRGPWDEAAVRACHTGTSCLGGEQEGYVVRFVEGFAEEDFGLSVAKYVREGHVQEDRHWSLGPVIPNHLL